MQQLRHTARSRWRTPFLKHAKHIGCSCSTNIANWHFANSIVIKGHAPISGSGLKTRRDTEGRARGAADDYRSLREPLLWRLCCKALTELFPEDSLLGCFAASGGNLASERDGAGVLILEDTNNGAESEAL